MLAITWMDTFSNAGGSNPPSNAPTRSGPAETLIVEQWDAETRRFVGRELVWDGKSYVEVK